jgi:hypothetical protein
LCRPDNVFVKFVKLGAVSRIDAVNKAAELGALTPYAYRGD